MIIYPSSDECSLLNERFAKEHSFILLDDDVNSHHSIVTGMLFVLSVLGIPVHRVKHGVRWMFFVKPVSPNSKED